MRLLCFAGSLRKDSANKKFVKAAQHLIKDIGGHETEFLDLRDYPMPPYDGDIEADSGIPESTKKLGDKIRAADGLILSTPEYNASIPGTLKNVIDWLSRERPSVSLTQKPLFLMAASPGPLGGERSLWATRVPLELLEVHVYPSMMRLTNAYEAFDESGKLKDAKTEERLKKLLSQFVQHHS